MFGKSAYTMTAYHWQQTGAAREVLVRCERLPWGRGYVAHFEPLPAPLDAALRLP